jgi:hypothetical protein
MRLRKKMRLRKPCGIYVVKECNRGQASEWPRVQAKEALETSAIEIPKKQNHQLIGGKSQNRKLGNALAMHVRVSPQFKAIQLAVAQAVWAT